MFELAKRLAGNDAAALSATFDAMSLRPLVTNPLRRCGQTLAQALDVSLVFGTRPVPLKHSLSSELHSRNVKFVRSW